MLLIKSPEYNLIGLKRLLCERIKATICRLYFFIYHAFLASVRSLKLLKACPFCFVFIKKTIHQVKRRWFGFSQPRFYFKIIFKYVMLSVILLKLLIVLFIYCTTFQTRDSYDRR